MEMDYTPVRKARLTQDEFARLCGVSRVTANMWLRETKPVKPNRFVEYTVSLQLQRINEAVGLGLLPLSGTVRREARMEKITDAVAKAARSLEDRAARSNS